MIERRAEELFQAALSYTPGEREAFVDEVCAGDAELRQKVLSLLRHHDRLGDFMDRASENEASTRRIQPDGLTPGQLLGERYRLEERLGDGAMGEVWLAYDLKLCVDVALKRLHPHLMQDERRVSMLRQEVRAARDVTSPHVCRIYDLVESDLGELISMEYLDGWTVSHLLTERSPLDLAEAADIASQMLAGLGAIHEAGLIHRDLKPANVMITRSGRVVLMDFGVARFADATQGPSIAGTPAYMAPEQMRPGELDTRCDIYAMGIILAEMSSTENLSTLEKRKALWERLRGDPPEAPQGPWRGLIQRCLAADPERRFASAGELARALEESLYHTGDLKTEKSPYPGLSTFTEEDARFFFGREFEVEQAWKKLMRAPMVAVIGPSGVGKSSFVNAGVLPAAPPEWDCIRCVPGRSPALNLAEALSPRFEKDAAAMRQLLHFEDADAVVRLADVWRRQHGEALLVLDQFEELFTQNSEEVQARFAQLLGRLNLEADIHILVSMRDDFFFLCHRYPELGPLAVGTLLLAPLSGDDLRRALVQPAHLSGYQFENETLIEEMLDPVRRERGALPLLAFAAARLWERRSRTTGQLTREAYETIGGVEGALAQHAENVMERIGPEREGMVRELFRNLVTAHRTRVARERDELLSVFEDRKASERVLHELVDARLLVSYERDEGDQRRHEVEIIHESLLSAWPRLVRWETQDADGAQLRDQFRQAAQLWEERSRSEDLLWSGTAYREFELWRDRYEGGLSESEAAFAQSMNAHESRRKRRRRVAVTSLFAALLAILAVVNVLRLDAVREKRQTLALQCETRADDLLEKTNNTAALAHAIAGLEQTDRPGLRALALAALWSRPARFPLPIPEDYAGVGYFPIFSPDGKWLVAGGDTAILAWPSNGSDPLRIHSGGGFARAFYPDGRGLLLTKSPGKGTPAVQGSYRLLQVAFPSGQLEWSAESDTAFSSVYPAPDGGFLIVKRSWPDPDDSWWAGFERWSPDGTRLQRLGEVHMRDWGNLLAMPSGDTQWLAWANGREVLRSPLESFSSARGQLLGVLEHEVRNVGISHGGDLVSATDGQALVIWRVRSDRSSEELHRSGHHELSQYHPSARHGSLMAQRYRILKQFDFRAPSAATGRPLMPESPGSYPAAHPEGIHPALPWLAVGNAYGWRTDLVPLNNPYPHDLNALQWDEITDWKRLRVAPDGNLLLQIHDNLAYIVDLRSADLERRQIFRSDGGYIYGFSFDEEGTNLALGTMTRGARIVPLDDGRPTVLEGAPTHTFAVCFLPDGERIVASGGFKAGKDGGRLFVFGLDGSLLETLGRCHDEFESHSCVVWPLDDAHVLTTCWELELLIWNIDTGEKRRLLASASLYGVAISENLVAAHDPDSGIVLFDRASLEEVKRIEMPEPENILGFEISPDESFVAAGYGPGVVRIRYLDQSHHHELPWLPNPDADATWVSDLWIDPTCHWILVASPSALRYWPVPRGEPVLDRPLDEFLDILKAQTNVRVVLDTDAPEGFHLTESEFPGWETIPSWQDWWSEEYMQNAPWRAFLPEDELEIGRSD